MKKDFCLKKGPLPDKKISVVMAVYNQADLVGDAIMSILSSTVGPDHLELIIVNDASTDQTMDVLRGYEARYPDTLLIVDCPENGRQGRAKNIGVSYASGDYLTFVDSDDLIAPDMLETLLLAAEESGADITECEYQEFTDRSIKPYSVRSEGSDWAFVPKSRSEKEDFFWTYAVGGDQIWCRLFTMDFYRNADLCFPEHLTMDDIYFGELSILTARSLCHISSRMYWYYQNLSGTIHGEGMKRNYMDRLTSFALLVEELKRRGLFEEYRDLLGNLYFHRLFMDLTYFMREAFPEFPEKNYLILRAYFRETFPDFITCGRLSEDERNFLKKHVYG